MRKKSLLLMVGSLMGLLLMPPQIAHAQWTVFDPAQYELQISKKLEEATRWIQTVNYYSEKLTRLKGILDLTEDLVAKQRNAITTMSNIGQTVRGAFQLKRQLEALVTTRIRALKSIDDRLRNGIFDPEQDMRDFEEYLRDSIGRTSQDTVANLERLSRMDNKLERLRKDMETARARRAWAEGKQTETLKKLKEEDAKSASERCASCIATLNQEMASYEVMITQLDSEISRLDAEILERVKLYNVEMEERVRFGEQVQSMNERWKRFNNSLDELQSALRKVN
jgi:chromosome segregation ATPase